MEQNNQNLPAVQQAQVPSSIPATSIFSEMVAFENAQRVAKMLAASTLVPQQFQGNVPNVMIALEMANRLNASPFMVMQNMYIVHGRPGFSATYVIASINACGRFSPLRFEISGEGDDRSCYAWVIEKSTGDRLEGSPVSIRMAKTEGWYNKQGSKWQTMPEQMLRYRAAAFFGRLYAPDILMGMQTAEEAEDIGPASWTPSAPTAPSGGPARMEEAVTIDAEVVEQPAEPLSGVDAINAMLGAKAEGDSPGRLAAARPLEEGASCRGNDGESGESSPTGRLVSGSAVGAVREPPLQGPLREGAAAKRRGSDGTAKKTEPTEAEPPHPAEAPEAAEAAGAAPDRRPAEPDEHRAMLRYIKELDDKAGMSELRGWADRRRRELARDLGGEDSEFFQAVIEHWKGLVAELPPQQ